LREYSDVVDLPETHYVRSGEIAIAYQVHGGGPYDIVFSDSSSSNVETVWQLPEAVRLFERLGQFARVIRFDRRDTGISDPVKDDLTLEAHVADALAVMDATAAQRPFLVGGAYGARSLAALAATRPERVAGLIAVSGTVRGAAAQSSETADAIVRGITDLSWPEDLLELWIPQWASYQVRMERALRFARTCSTPRQAERLLRMALTSDSSEVLPLVQAPTLVLHPRDSFVITSDSVQEFANLIPNAVYREMSGDAYGLLYALDVDELADIVEEFVTGTTPKPVSSRVLATVLFTDVVGSTQRAAQMGDSKWAQLLDRHHSSARIAITDLGGTPIKTLGDGILATFTGPAQAVRSAKRIVEETHALGLGLRAGIHTGELEVSKGDVAGMAVHLAARVMGQADDGEVLVSRTVRDLVIGSELRFSERGEHELKGIPERWPLYALAP
jgi:class 3 adenylate cyclase